MGLTRVPRKPIGGIEPNPVGAHDWHVQIERHGEFVKLGSSEGSKTFALGFLVGYMSGNPDYPELHLCDAAGRTFVAQ